MNPDQVHAARSPDLEVFAMGGQNFMMPLWVEEVWCGSKHYIPISLRCHGLHFGSQVIPGSFLVSGEFKSKRKSIALAHISSSHPALISP